MASVCIQQKYNSFPVASVFDDGIQPSRLPALAGVCSSENGEIPDSGDDDDNDDDDDLPSVSKIVAESRRVQPQTPPQVIDLTCDSDSDDAETTSSLSTDFLWSLPTSSSHEPTHTTPLSCPAAALPGRKKSPWKKIPPPWALSHDKIQRALNPFPSKLPMDALRSASDHAEPTLTASEPEPEDARALIGQPGDWPEIPETPAVVFDNVRSEEDDHSGDGEDDPDREVQTPYGALTLADDRVLDVDKGEAAEMQRVDQTESALDMSYSDESPISVAESSGQTLGPGSASSLPDLSDKDSVMVYISNFTTRKIIDKRPEPSGVEYKCEFQPIWLAAESVEAAQMGRVRIRDYENGLVRVGRLETLRERKRKFSQV